MANRNGVLPAASRLVKLCLGVWFGFGLLATTAVANPNCLKAASYLAAKSDVSRWDLEARSFDPGLTYEQIRAQLKTVVANEAQREELAKVALSSMKARESEILRTGNLAQKKIVVIGAGIHATIFLSNLIARNPEIAKHVLVLEASDVVTANYGKNQPFRINSGKPPFVDKNAQPNLFPGAVVTPEDADYQGRGDYYPNPKLFAETAAIALRAQNVDVLFRRAVSGIHEIQVGGTRRYAVKTANGETFQADTIVMATGVSHLKANIPGLEEALKEEKAKASGDRDYNRYVPRVEVYTDLLARLGQEGPRDFSAYRGKTIGVIGAQHGGNITIETFLGKEPDMVKAGFPSADLAKVVWWNQKATTKEDFLKLQKPGGGDAPRPLFSTRYSLYGLPEAWDQGLIEPIPTKTTRIERLANGQTRVYSLDEQGQESFRDVDYLFVAAGFEPPAFPVLRQSFGLGVDGKVELQPVSSDLQGQQAQVGSRFVANGKPQDIYVVGPGAGVKVDPAFLEKTVTGSPESINALGQQTASFGRWLRRVFLSGGVSTKALPPQTAFGR